MKRFWWIPVVAILAIFAGYFALVSGGDEPMAPERTPPPAPVAPVPSATRPVSAPQLIQERERPPTPMIAASLPSITDDERGSQAEPEGDDDGGIRFPPSRDGIRAAVEASHDALRECYAPWLELAPELHGHLHLSILIGPGDGGVARIDEVKVQEATTDNRALEGCVRSVFASLRFESPEEAIRFSYPLIFVPEDPDGG